MLKFELGQSWRAKLYTHWLLALQDIPVLEFNRKSLAHTLHVLDNVTAEIIILHLGTRDSKQTACEAR